MITEDSSAELTQIYTSENIFEKLIMHSFKAIKFLLYIFFSSPFSERLSHRNWSIYNFYGFVGK